MNPFDPPTTYHQAVLERKIGWPLFKEWILEKFRLSSDQFEKILWHGGMFINQKRIDNKTIPTDVSSGGHVEVFLFLQEPSPIVLTPAGILHEDERLLAINKPAWIAVQPTRVSQRYCLETYLREVRKNPVLTAVHRIDRQTSGVVLFAKTRRAIAEMMEAFREGRVKKKYLAIVSPPPPEETWTQEGYLVRDFRKIPRIYYRLVPEKKGKGRWSRTKFRRIKTQGDLALVEAYPETGRTHQIRVHLKASRCSLVGDPLYGMPHPEVSRMQLHAAELAVDDLIIRAPIPQDFILA